MKRITPFLVVFGVVLLFGAGTCFAQMYTITDLGTLGGSDSEAIAINNVGQVIGVSNWSISYGARHAFRTGPNKPISAANDDLGYIGINDINDLGQVVGRHCPDTCHAYRTGPNAPLDPTTDILDVSMNQVNVYYSEALAINNSAQVTGYAWPNATFLGFRTAPNSLINPATDSIGIAGVAINTSGQVVGCCSVNGSAARTDPNGTLHPTLYDLGTLGGTWGSQAHDINDSGQVVGYSFTPDNKSVHAFRTAPNLPINSSSDDLGTLFPGDWSYAHSINNYGQVVGLSSSIPFIYDGGAMHDLNGLVVAPAHCGLYLDRSLTDHLYVSINDAGQIATTIMCGPWSPAHAVRLDPIYKAFVQQPINADGSSVFSAKRGTVPVKFRLTQYDAPTCTLLPATIALTRAGGGTLVSVDESVYSTQADSGSNFRIDPTACQYVYNLATSSLGAGTYRVDISINGIMIGHAVFALK